MKTKISNIIGKNVFFLLIGALFSAPLVLLGGGGFVSGDVLLFSLAAFIISLTPVFFSKATLLKSCRIRSTYQPMISRKNLTHRNDPLLM